MAGAQTSLTLQDRMTGPLRSIMRAMESTIRVMEQMNEAANIDPAGIERAQNAIQNANAAMNRYMSESAQSIGGNTTAQAGLNNEIRAGTINMKGFAVAVLSAVGAYKAFNAAKNFLKGILSQGIEFHAFKQASESAFTTFLGDAETAKQYMDDMYAFALTTPFAYPDLLESSRNLIAFGMTAENTFPVMEAIGDAVAAIGGGNAELQSMADIFGMIQVQGKLTMMEVNRLGGHGVNAIQMLAESAGVSGDEIKKQISAGAIDAGMAIEALVNGIDKQFGGSMAGLKGTWAGAIDSMKSSMRNAGTALMEPFMKVEGPLVTLVQNVTGVFKKIPQYVGPAVSAFLPLIAMLNEAFRANRFDGIFNGLSAGLTTVANIAANTGMVMIWVLSEISAVGSLIATHWDLISPVITVAAVALGSYLAILVGYKTAMLVSAAITGVKAFSLGVMAAASTLATGSTLAQTAAQHGLNAALLAFPGTWILIGFVAVIALVIFAMVRWADETAVVVGAIVGFFYWLGAAVHNIIMGIANFMIAGIEFMVNAWRLGTYAIEMLWIGFWITVWTILDAIGNAAIGTAEWFVNTWNQAMFLAQLAWIGLNIMARMVLDSIGNAALGAAEWFVNTWNDGVFGVQTTFHKMGVFVGTTMSGVASGTVGVVNSALGAISTLINAATTGLNKMIGMINNIPGVNISTIGTVDLKMGAGITDFAKNIGKNLEAPAKAERANFGRMNTAGTYMSNMDMPTAPKNVDFGTVNNAARYANNVKEPTMPEMKSFDRMEYTSLGDAFDRGNEVGKNLSLSASDKLAGAIDKVTGLMSRNEAPDEPPDVKEPPNFDYDPTNGNPAGIDSPPGSKGPAGTKANPTGGKLDKIGKIEDDINIADEDLQMFRELADIKSIQNFVTLTPKVEFNGMTIREEADVDKITKAIEKSMKDEVARSAEGVYT